MQGEILSVKLFLILKSPYSDRWYFFFIKHSPFLTVTMKSIPQYQPRIKHAIGIKKIVKCIHFHCHQSFQQIPLPGCFLIPYASYIFQEFNVYHYFIFKIFISYSQEGLLIFIILAFQMVRLQKMHYHVSYRCLSRMSDNYETKKFN